MQIPLPNYRYPENTETEKKLIDAKQKLEDVPEHHRCIFRNTLAAQEWRAEVEKAIITSAAVDYSGTGTIITKSRQGAQLRHGHLQPGDIGAAQTVSRLLEQSDEFKAASAIIAPIEAEIAALEAQHLKEREDHAAAATEHRGLLEKVSAAALESVKSHPKLVEIGKKLGLN